MAEITVIPWDFPGKSFIINKYRKIEKTVLKNVFPQDTIAENLDLFSKMASILVK
jgi:hypothetical protein